MAKTSRQYVFDGMEMLPERLTLFVEARLSGSLSGHWQVEVQNRYKALRIEGGYINWDQQSLFQVMNIFWDQAFRDVFGRHERAWVNELVEWRNKLSHDEKFTYADSERALDTMSRLMEAISAGDIAQQLQNMRAQILKVRFAEQSRGEERRSHRTNMTVKTVAGLKPWRSVIEPHHNVTTGEFAQAEFAASLSQVYDGEAAPEYGDAKQFFAHTYITAGLGTLLKDSARRLSVKDSAKPLSGTGGDPVIELKTNFGGGKTHSLLALYHMVGGTSLHDLAGLDQLLADIKMPENIHRAVFVGTKRGPMDIWTPQEGIEIKTIWGSLAWQLGGRAGFDLVRAQNAAGIAPGTDILGQLFRTYSPCLILIDEWVAYLRQIYKQDNLPSGTFDANLSFVQALTEAVKSVPGTLLVASLPESDIEIGGEGGQAALKRLEQSFGRVQKTWKPASTEESYEIVRRRLFNDIAGENTVHRDNAVKQFAKMYREDRDNFPHDCDQQAYRQKMELSYPIHPELFDQLHDKWAALPTFQRTRGILRLMAQVVHELWRDGDQSIMIMPGCIPLVSEDVQPELTKYLAPSWPNIISADIDGTQSAPHRIDKEQTNLGRIAATKRVARTLFLSTAPSSALQHTGVEAKTINLGTVQPGERPVTFSDALHRLSNAAAHIHSEGGRYRYTTAISLNKVASDTASQYDEDTILDEIDRKLSVYINRNADRSVFDAVHAIPASSADIPDDTGGVRIVVLGVRAAHSPNTQSSEAIAEAKHMIGFRGTAPRVFKNVLVFLSADNRQLDHLKEVTRSALAWTEIVDNKDRDNLTQADVGRAEKKAKELDNMHDTRLKEAWCWIIYPAQHEAAAEVSYETSKLSAQDGLFYQIFKKLDGDNVLYTTLGPSNLNRTLDKYIWQDKPHIRTADLLDYHSRYIYMQRLSSKAVLQKTIQSAVSQSVPGPFAYAEQFDEQNNDYSGLIIENGINASIALTPESVILRPEIAVNSRQKSEILAGGANTNDTVQQPSPSDPAMPAKSAEQQAQAPELPKCFTGSVSLSSDRPGNDMLKINEGIINQLNIIEGAQISITLEIHAYVPDGIDNSKRRTLLENADTLKFSFKDVK